MKSRPFEQLFSVGTGFCMGFLKSSKTDHNPFLFKNCKYKAKAAQIKRFKRLMLELLGRFELPTSSLPTTVEPSSPCCIRLCGVFFCPKRMRSQPVCSIVSVRSFPVWVTVWVKQLSGRERGAHLRQRQAEPHQMPVWFCSYPYKTSSRRESSKIAYRRFCQKRSSKLKLSHSYFSFQKRTAVIKEYADTLAF